MCKDREKIIVSYRTSNPDPALFLRISELEEALDISLGWLLIGIATTYIGKTGPIYDLQLPDRSGECGCLRRIFTLPFSLYAGPWNEIRWEAHEENVVRRSWQKTNSAEIFCSILYRMLPGDVTGEDLREMTAWTVEGSDGIGRLIHSSMSVLPAVQHIVSRAGIPLYAPPQETPESPSG